MRAEENNVIYIIHYKSILHSLPLDLFLYDRIILHNPYQLICFVRLLYILFLILLCAYLNNFIQIT